MSTIRVIATAAVLLILPACGSDGAADELSADLEAVAEEATEHEHTGDCAAFHRIVAARDDQPAFSSLGRGDWPSGAVRCEIVSQIEPPLLWGQYVARTSYECMLYEAPVGTPAQEAQMAWTNIRGEGHACFQGWEIGAAGARDDSEFGGHRTLTMSSDAAPSLLLEDGSAMAPVWFDWRNQTDPTGDRPGHQVTFTVVAND